MQNDSLAFLRILHLADSALPVGAAAHSLGLETLVAEGSLHVEILETFLGDYLAETGALECAFCLLGYRLACQFTTHTLDVCLEQWLDLQMRLSAYKTARESRQASAALGRRFLQLAQGLHIHPWLVACIQAAKNAAVETHYSIAFGLVCGLLGVDETSAGLAYLQQSLTGLVSACQRLLPLGQSQASQILWHLYSMMPALVESSRVAATDGDIFSFATLVEIGSSRHPVLTTRLFIS